MQLLQSLARAAAFLGLARRQLGPDSSAYHDRETGLAFASYTTDNGIAYRVAIPDPVPTNATYDVVLQIVSPKAVGWAGWPWGGHMTYNPLAVAWANGTHNVVLSSRMATGYFSPPGYPDAKYTVLKKGTHMNATHWQVTAKCSGCTQWGDADTGYGALDPTTQQSMAYAYSNTAVDTPADEASTFSIHNGIGHPVYNLTQGKNTNFAAKVSRLMRKHWH